MPFTGNEDHHISLDDAAKLTKKYRDSVGAGSTIAGFFGKTALQKMLDQAGCVGIRIYYGLSEDNKPQPVLVGAKSDQNDIYDGELAEIALNCPPYCSKANPLNS